MYCLLRLRWMMNEVLIRLSMFIFRTHESYIIYKMYLLLSKATSSLDHKPLWTMPSNLSVILFCLIISYSDNSFLFQNLVWLPFYHLHFVWKSVHRLVFFSSSFPEHILCSVLFFLIIRPPSSLSLLLLPFLGPTSLLMH